MLNKNFQKVFTEDDFEESTDKWANEIMEHMEIDKEMRKLMKTLDGRKAMGPGECQDTC